MTDDNGYATHIRDRAEQFRAFQEKRLSVSAFRRSQRLPPLPLTDKKFVMISEPTPPKPEPIKLRRRCYDPDDPRLRKNKLPPAPSKIETTRIIAVACEVCNVTLVHIMSDYRDLRIVRPRQLAYLLVRELRPDLSPSVIGRVFGDRDRTTIVSGIQRARQRILERDGTEVWYAQAKALLK